jgi:hypothetical protein
MSSLSVVEVIFTLLLTTVLTSTESIKTSSLKPVGDGVLFTPLHSKVTTREYETEETINNNKQNRFVRLKEKRINILPTKKWKRRRSSQIAIPTQPPIHEECEEGSETTYTPPVLGHQTSAISATSTKTTSTIVTVESYKISGV